MQRSMMMLSLGEGSTGWNGWKRILSGVVKLFLFCFTSATFDAPWRELMFFYSHECSLLAFDTCGIAIVKVVEFDANFDDLFLWLAVNAFGVFEIS